MAALATAPGTPRHPRPNRRKAGSTVGGGRRPTGEVGVLYRSPAHCPEPALEELIAMAPDGGTMDGVRRQVAGQKASA